MWADFPAAIAPEGYGCFNTGFGKADGVGLLLLSTGEPFEYYDSDTEEFVSQVPAQEDVTVISLNAGETPFFVFEDC